VKLVTGEQRGCDMRLPPREQAFWVSLLAQSPEERHSPPGWSTAGSHHIHRRAPAAAGERENKESTKNEVLVS